MRIAGLCCVLAGLVLAGCGAQVATRTTGSTATQPELGRYKLGQPYEVGGKWYDPKVDYDYAETGIASWYGPKFHGKTTANGETFNQNALTAAHRTLPLPSMVRVTNLQNGRQLKLRVNDRGPYSRGRIIDVSARAAELLGFKADGTAKVRVEIVADESRRLAALAQGGGPPAERVGDGAAASGTGSAGTRGGVPRATGKVTFVDVADDAQIFIQAGAFVKYANARRLSGELSGMAPTRIEPARVNDRRFYRVRLGPMADVESADSLLASLADRGHAEAEVVVD